MIRFQLYTIALLFLVACAKPKEESTSEPEIVVMQNDLPALRLTFPDGQKTSARDLGGNTILFLFQPDCDHCQREAKEVARVADSFSKYKVYFISSAPIAEVVKFGQTYELDTNPNFLFAETPFEDVVNHIGPIETPSIYIYSSERKLIQSFNGEVAIEVVQKYL